MIRTMFTALTILGLATTASLAAPLMQQPITTENSSLVVKTSGSHYGTGDNQTKVFTHSGRDYRKGFYIHRGISYYNGHRGIQYARQGYRHHRGYWFPQRAFSIRVYVGPRIVAPPRHTRPQIITHSSQHVAWCQGRYKTYRAHDNTYAYKVGKRTYCRSPYAQ